MKKRQIADDAFAEIGIASYAFDVTAGEIVIAMRRLDGLAAQWYPQGIAAGYSFPAAGEFSDPDQDAGIPDSAYTMYYTNLALRLAPTYGKTISAQTLLMAKSSIEDYRLGVTSIPERCFPSTMPVGKGSGRSVRDNPYFYQCGCGSCGLDGSACLMPIACYNPLDGITQIVQELDINLNYQLPQEL